MSRRIHSAQVFIAGFIAFYFFSSSALAYPAWTLKRASPQVQKVHVHVQFIVLQRERKVMNVTELIFCFLHTGLAMRNPVPPRVLTVWAKFNSPCLRCLLWVAMLRPDAGRRSTNVAGRVARWTWRRDAPAYASIPDLTWPDLIWPDLTWPELT